MRYRLVAFSNEKASDCKLNEKPLQLQGCLILDSNSLNSQIGRGLVKRD